MKAYLSLGSNIGSRHRLIQTAIRLIGERVGRCEALSSLHETRPVGFSSDNMFLNAVVVIETTLSPTEVLNKTQQIEAELGRTHKSVAGTYSDRPMDIDILFMGDTVINTPDLQIPHPRLHERRFVLAPLVEVASEVVHPVSGLTAGDMLSQLNHQTTITEPAFSQQLLQDIRHLLSELSSTPHPLSEEYLHHILRSENTHLFVLYDEEQQLSGMATVCLCASPTGVKAWVEDVVVSAASRGRGYGRQLVNKCIETARMGDAQKVMLTSRPSREAANRLYRSMGFVPRETNVYSLDLHTAVDHQSEPN